MKTISICQISNVSLSENVNLGLVVSIFFRRIKRFLGTNLQIWWTVWLYTVFTVNAVSVGLFVSGVISGLPDQIIAYIHVATLIFQTWRTRNFSFVCLSILGVLTCIFPCTFVAFRPWSFVLMLGLFTESPSSLGDVVRLGRRTVSLSAWVLLVTLSFAWITVLLVTVLFDLKSTSTWLFLKPSDPDWFDISRFFGSTVRSLISVMQVITGDHYMSLLVRPLTIQYPPLILLFLSVQLVGTFGLLFVAVGLAVGEHAKILSERHKNGNERQTLYVQLRVQSLVNRLRRIDGLMCKMQPVDDRVTLFNSSL